MFVGVQDSCFHGVGSFSPWKIHHFPIFDTGCNQGFSCKIVENRLWFIGFCDLPSKKWKRKKMLSTFFELLFLTNVILAHFSRNHLHHIKNFHFRSINSTILVWPRYYFAERLISFPWKFTYIVQAAWIFTIFAVPQGKRLSSRSRRLVRLWFYSTFWLSRKSFSGKTL